jgi:hypothetical protein
MVMTLTKARAEANKAFKEARAAVVAGTVSARSTSEGLIAVFWDILRQLKGRDKALFQKWYDRKHDALRKELGAMPSRWAA